MGYHMTKRKLVIFRSLGKSVTLKIKKKIVNLREDRSLMTRLLGISRSRPGIGISELFAKHEFSVVPHSLFDNEGNMLKCSDKAAFLRGMEEIVAGKDICHHTDLHSCVVIDGMGFVNQLSMKDVIKLTDLVHRFTTKIARNITNYQYVILTFDSYDASLSHLKQGPWDTRHKVQVQFKLSPATVVKNITLKELLSHPKNKRILTDYFAKSCQRYLESEGRNYVIAFGTTIVSNVNGWRQSAHKHPEADTLMLCLIHELYALVPAKNVRLISLDTDDLMLALHYVATHPTSNVNFELLNPKGRRLVSVNHICDYYGADLTTAILGLYVFTGCDQLSAFNLITKDRVYKQLMNLKQDGNSSIITAPSSLGGGLIIWKHYIIILNPPLPSLIGNGWDENLASVMTDELPAPEISLELTVCKCKKSKCYNNQCSCHKNKLSCTEACQCNSCENESSSFEELEADD
ncbi:hypothetical protein ACHWQZ_G001063 [Mnemiopsis leidyi]